MADKDDMILHDPEKLRSLAKQLREEADRAEVKAKGIEDKTIEKRCPSGCWNVLSTCVRVEPL